MGNKDSKFTANQFNFRQYGLSFEEGKNLQKYFDEAAGTDHILDRVEFQKIYIQLDPNAQPDVVKNLAEKAFSVADTNGDGSLSLDEFAAFYIMHKSEPQNLISNLAIFLKHANGNSNVITTKQAELYANFAHGCDISNDQKKPTIQMVQSLHKKYGNEIPIDAFVDHAAAVSAIVNKWI